MKVAICDDMNEIVLELSEYIEQYFLTHNYNLTLFKFNGGKELIEKYIPEYENLKETLGKEFREWEAVERSLYMLK